VKKVFVILMLCVVMPCLGEAQEKSAINIPDDGEQAFSGGRPKFLKERPVDDFGKIFEGYVQVDDTWIDVRIVRSRTACGKTPDVGARFSASPLASIVERVEPMYVDWVQDDEEEWVFSPVMPIAWFDRIVVKPGEKQIFAEKIENGRLFTYAAKEVVGAQRCLEYRCGVLYKFDPKPIFCRWVVPKKGELDNCFQ